MIREWLLADGLGGYAMGCEDGIRRRKYHGLLLVASPTDERRYMLVNGVEAWLETERGRVWLSSHRYAPDVEHPDGASRITSFTADPWPVWSYRVERGVAIEHEIAIARGHAATLLTWRLVGAGTARLCVRPLMSGRDWHATHRENGAFCFDVETENHALVWTPYAGVPSTIARATGRYEHSPVWYRQFSYDEERNRGLDFVEDLASPGIFSFELGEASPSARLLLTTSSDWGGAGPSGTLEIDPAAARPSDAYFASRRGRDTIIAGYPWFTDWGRDTFIALPGLCLASGNLSRAQRILESWCDVLSDGMMPNLFPSGGAQPEFNSVDASLWFVVAVRELVDEAARRGAEMKAKRLTAACEEIVQRYAAGARYGIRMDSDGLLAAGEAGAGVALTWMDAIVDGVPVTPRVGKPVEVQALWINALTFAASWNEKWSAVCERARMSFETKFLNAARGCLYDVIDADHVAGRVDDRVRPNQIFVCGGLPVALLDGKRAEAVVAVVERELWTPMGLRTLSPADPEYVGRADGPMRQRDRAYHQGTVWPWLTYAFLDAKARTSVAASPEARATITRKYLGGLRAHVPTDGVGHVSEIADGDAPHTPRGCPFQAWSLAALLRSQG